MEMNKTGKKTFVTLFPSCSNSELVKDVGMIPYVLYKHFGFNSIVASSKIDIEGNYINAEVKGLKIDCIDEILHNEILSGLMYILKNSKKIDILNIYHFRPKRNFIWIWLFKMLNPRGKVYVKLDMGIYSYRVLKAKKNKKASFLKYVDIISVESKCVKEWLERDYNINVKLIPNGYYSVVEKKQNLLKRENVVVTVGRLGTEEKATDILLDAFLKSIDRHDWNLKLIGPLTTEFEIYKEKFFETNPKAIDRIEFVGEIRNREKLFQEYKKARVFILPSRHEGFPLVLPEAMKNGCYLILSDMVSPAEELTQKEKYGLIVKTNDVNSLSDGIIKTCCMDIDWDLKAKEIEEFAGQEYEWSKICGELVEYIEGEY